MGKSVGINCPHCNGTIKITAESNPRKVLISHEEIPDTERFIEFPCVGEPSIWWLTHSWAKELAATYPGVEIEEESRKILAWIKANPRCGKTYRGFPKFINSWFNRAQNSTKSKPQTKEEMMEVLK